MFRWLRAWLSLHLKSAIPEHLAATGGRDAYATALATRHYHACHYVRISLIDGPPRSLYLPVLFGNTLHGPPLSMPLAKI
jgi:hypothetical protein